jgi:hemerythrin-like domain-containing protein
MRISPGETGKKDLATAAERRAKLPCLTDVAFRRALTEEVTPMKLWDLLKHDHQQVAKIFAQLGDTKDRARQEELFKKLKAELQLHTKIEEAHFYPALNKHEETKDLAKEAAEEHGEVKKMLRRLSSLAAGGDKFLEVIGELRHSVEHHVEEEETEIFPAAENALEARQLDDIAVEITKEKQTAKVG